MQVGGVLCHDVAGARAQISPEVVDVQVMDLLMEQQTLLSPVEDLLTSALEIFEDDEKCGVLPPLGFHFFQFSKAHNSEIS